MRLAIIGAGKVGGALGTGWARAGHTIIFGVPDPADGKHATAAAAAGGAEVAAVDRAAGAGEAIVLAVPWEAAPAAIQACGDVTGRVLIDVTNPVRFVDGGLELALGFDRSGGEQVAQLARGARVVKTMNQVGFGVMSDTRGYVSPPVMFAAGDDAAAKQLALGLVADLGFDARDAGPLKMARLLEPMAMLWISQVVVQGAPADSAFAFLTSRAR